MVKVHCEECSIEFNKAPSQILKSKHQFCSKECYLKFYNPLVACSYCGNKFRKQRSQIRVTSNNFCSKSCAAKLNNIRYPKRHVSHDIQYIRRKARSEFKALIKSWTRTACQLCGYDKFTNWCHIKPISEITSSKQIKEYNDVSNIIELCPNCHTELDNGLITKEDIHVRVFNTNRQVSQIKALVDKEIRTM